MGVHRGAAIGCTAVQVFTSSPQMWKAKPVSDQMVNDFQDACARTGIDHVVSHDSYLVNLAAPDEAMREKSYGALREEMVRCGQYGIGWVVSHIGAHLGDGVPAGLQRAAELTKRLISETPSSVILLAETTAGQGSSLNSRFEEMGEFLDLCGRPERLGVCLDTAHIFAAGYDIRTAESYHATFEEFDRLVGLNAIRAIHCNDSKKDLGTRVDRHAHIGEGFIGIEAFNQLVNDPRFFDVPILLETPEAETMHAENLERLRGLVRDSA